MRIGLILAVVLALGGAVVATPNVAGQGAPIIAIDMEITGNDDSTVGAIQDCAELSVPGDTLTFDLIIQGIDTADKIAGYQIDIDYDASVITVTNVIGVDGTPTDQLTGGPAAGAVSILSRIDSLGGTHFLNLSEMVPDSDGSFTAAAIDGTLDPFPPGNHEDGDGVLARITVEAVGTGVSPLIIAGPAGGADGNPDLIIMGGAGELRGKELPVGDVLNAAVSVGATCVTPPPDTTQDTQEPPPDAGEPVESGVLPAEGMDETQTDLVVTDAAPFSVGDFIQIDDEIMENTAIDGNTLTVERCVRGTTCTLHATDAPILLLEDETGGATGADTQADGTPGSGVGTQTPVLGGTPATGDEAGAGGEATDAGDSDDGLSAVAWAGIGAGFAAAASVAGWFALRRRRARGTPTSGGEAGPE